MKLVLITVAHDDAALLDANLAYHLNAGVDFAIVADHEPSTKTREVLERYVQEGLALGFSTRAEAGEGEAALRNRMAQLAVSEHDASWVIDSRVDEFWWPRGESLKDVLVGIPPRYAIVQGLERVFLPRLADSGFWESMTVRPSLESLDSHAPASAELPLRPLHRAGPHMMIGSGTRYAGRIPLRAWYPIEVLRFPVRTAQQSVPSDEEVARGIAEGSLVVDERLRDALRSLGTGERFQPPLDGVSRLTFKSPDVVDDAAYAVECAAVGEVDLASLERHIRELEARIAFLEERLWPRILRSLSRLGGGARMRR
jgi:hypothetical protein